MVTEQSLNQNRLSLIFRSWFYPTIAVFLSLRILTFIFAALSSHQLPLHEIEKNIAVWPHTQPIAEWTERVFLAPFLRWDVEWYVKIATEGYRPDDGTAQFHPLYPLLSVPLNLLSIHPVASLLIISSIFTLLLLLLFHRLARFDLEPQQAFLSTFWFMIFPVSAIFFIPYSEPVFIFFALACFYYLRRKNWWLAAAAGGLAALTRQQGVFLAFPLAWELWEHSGRNFKMIWKERQAWFSLILVPAGLFIWIFSRALLLNDLQVNTQNLQSFIYSFIISSSADQVVPEQAFLLPWHSLSLALVKAWTAPDLDIITNLVLAGFMVWIFTKSWPEMRPSARLYSLVIFLVSFSLHTGPIHPYMGLPRHLLLAVPIFVPLGKLIIKPAQRLVLTAIHTGGFLFLILLFVAHSWVP
jgi:Gpi18-like mannosyltransferase